MARTLALALVAVTLVVTVATVSAARPTPGAVYKGKTGKGKKVRLKVSDSGKRLTFRISCGIDRATVRRVKVRRTGRFHLERRSFAARGRFKTRKRARGTIEGLFCSIGQDSWTARRR